MTAVDWHTGKLPRAGGRTFLVTGATAGVGYFVAEQLASTGAEVILAARNATKADLARPWARRLQAVAAAVAVRPPPPAAPAVTAAPAAMHYSSRPIPTKPTAAPVGQAAPTASAVAAAAAPSTTPLQVPATVPPATVVTSEGQAVSAGIVTPW